MQDDRFGILGEAMFLVGAAFHEPVERPDRKRQSIRRHLLAQRSVALVLVAGKLDLPEPGFRSVLDREDKTYSLRTTSNRIDTVRYHGIVVARLGEHHP